MLAQLFSLCLIALATATPVALERRQSTSTTENEFTTSGCRNVIFFFARGTSEIGNMGTMVGPPTSDGLKSAFGETNVATEGIDYAALISTNLSPLGADPAGISEMATLLNQAATQCPNSKLVAAGYSQGAALVHGAIRDLSAAVKAKIVGVVTYGDTRNTQDNAQIPNFPKEKLLIICNTGDAVCAGTLTILPAHLDYARRVPEGVAFLVSKINGS